MSMKEKSLRKRRRSKLMKLRRQRKILLRPPQSNNRQRTPDPGNPGNSGNPDPDNLLLPHFPLQSRLPQQQLSL